MIQHPFLYLLVSRLNDLRRPGVNADDSDHEHQQIDRMLNDAGPGDTAWGAHAMNAYTRLERRDLADVPVRTHHWFLERLRVGPWLQDAPDLFENLYDLLDPVGRFLLVRAISRRTGDVVFEPLASVFNRCARVEDRDVRNRRTRELVDLLVDVWLSERAAVDRGERRQDSRLLPPWFREAILSAVRSPALEESARAVLSERAEALDPETARELLGLH